MPTHDEQLWEQADRILDQLLDLPESQRRDRLRALTLSPELDACVGRLLRAHADSGALDRPVAIATTPPLAGRRIGDWVLQRELGRGGMSVVWEAIREGDPAGQRAALKLLTVGALGRDEAHRFRRERNLLARLNHPYIAHLYDAGEADDGTPFLAMERVDGVRIDRWCDQHAPTARQRVRCVLDVCDAIAYAHRNLVVHADLKPSNVLVDDEGHVRVLDFGIGRLLDGHRERTGTAWHALTPDYAAPEQLAGAAATTATDVFGLGALLYRLLVGRAPRTADAGPDITAPSRAVLRLPGVDAASRRALARSLNGDLDLIVLKALHTAPEQRYLSVDALADDLRAWLQSRPVQARRPGVSYRLRKFAARHRLGLAASLALVLVLLGGIGTTLWQAGRAGQQAARAVAVKDFLVEILESADPTRAGDRDPRASELLRAGARRIRTALGDRPQVRAELLLVIGRSQLARGQLVDARTSLDAALALFTRGVARDPATQADLLAERGMLDYEQGRYPQALRRLRQAEALLGHGVPRDSPVHDRVLSRLADIEVVAGHPRQAADVARGLIADMRRGGRQQHDDYSYALRTLGEAANEQQRYADAVGWLRQARDALGAQPQPVDRGGIDNELGIAYDGLGREAEAAHAFSSALALQTRIYGLRHPTTLATLANLASVHLRQGRATSAAAEYARIVPMQRAILGDGPHPDLVASLGWLALARYRAGDTRVAWDTAQQALAMTRALAPADRVDLGWVAPLDGLLGWELGRPDAGALLAKGDFGCTRVETMHALERWVCLARDLREADAGRCRVPAGAAPANGPVGRVDRRWWAVYHLLRARCGDPAQRAAELGAARALEAASAEGFPDWLRARLAAAVASS